MKSHHKQAITLLLSCSLLLGTTRVLAQTETIPNGSFIVNMGVVPQTIANAIKPYGMIYDLVKNYNVPVKWVIGENKVKDGIDFTYNGNSYRGGTFIINSSFRSAAVNARIAFWQAQGVVGVTTTSNFSVTVSFTISSPPKWTLDAANGSIAEGYLANAGITPASFPNAYNWKNVQSLDCCDDFFVMPHADPTWATHSNLYNWNKNCLGSIWAACHAVSALTNSINPSDNSQQMNFLTQRNPVYTPTPWPNNSLMLWTTHNVGSIPYTHRLFSDPVAQYMGTTDAAQLNGSEQIYIPVQSGVAKWNPGAKLIAYDPTQSNVLSVNPDLSNAAALIVYGRGFDDPTRGYVMYEAGHSHNKGTTGDVAAQRAFFNFSFFQVQPKAPNLVVTGITGGQIVPTTGGSLNLSVNATSPLMGVTFSYLWTSTCGGVFSNPTAASTTFNPATATPGSCMITVKVTDNCGRTSFQSFPITITPPPAPPTAVNDAAAIASCSPGTAVTVNVLRNDSDPQGSPLTITSMGVGNPANAGVWAITPDSSVTFTPDPNFAGLATITYTVTNGLGQSSNATISITVGNTDSHGCSQTQTWGIASTAFMTVEDVINNVGATAAMTNGSATDPRLDDIESTFASSSNTTGDFVDMGTATTNLVDFQLPVTLNIDDTVVIYWGKRSNNGTTVLSMYQSATSTFSGSATNQTLTGTGNFPTVTRYPVSANGTNYIRVKVGTGTTQQLYLDAVAYEKWSCVTKQPTLLNDAITILEDVPTAIDVLSNDVDPQGLTITLKQITSQPSFGKVSINTDGTITYLNTTDLSGTDAFTYQACNSQGYCNTATVTVIVSDDVCAAGNYKANPPGGAVTKVFQSGFAGTNAATANATATNFRDAFLDFQNANTNKGTTTSIETGKAFASSKSKRSVVYFNISEIPGTAIVQSASFSATRVGGDGNTQVVNLHQIGNSWVENQTSWNNRSTGPATPWTTAGGDFNPTVEASATVTSSNIANFWSIVSLTQNWVTTPANNFGLLLKTGEVLDKRHKFATKENGTLASRPKLTITYVVPQPCAAITNRAPLANPDYATVYNGQAVVISPLTNDNDVDAGNTFTVTGISGITAGSAIFTANSITYTANISATVPRTERLTYTITDNNGATDIAYVYITVINAPPLAVKDLSSALSGVAQNVTVTTNDSDPEGGALSAPVITVNPRFGTASAVGNVITYTPVTGFTGNDTLIYRLSESAAGSCSPDVLSDTALVVFTVQNRPPTAVNDNKSVLPCLATTFNLIANDTDPENGALSVTNLSPLSNPAAGVLVNNGDGTVTFTPAAGFSGPVSFTYTVTDNGVTPSTSAPATVSITVSLPANNAPIALDDAETTNVNTMIYVSVLDNDSDPDGQPLTKPVITVAPLHGTATVMNNGLIEYIPSPGYFGSDVLTYQICDIVTDINCNPAPALCATANVNITINNIFVLPVTGLQLTGKLNGVYGILDWKTESEINSHEFIIERSVDNRQFVAVGYVAASGNTQTRHWYHFADEISSLAESNFYYRIKQVDIDGRAAYSNTIVVKKAKPGMIESWPNPFDNYITINYYASSSSSLQIKLINASGQVVRQEWKQVYRGSNQLVLTDFDKLSAGVYILSAEDNSGQTRFRQVLIRK